VHAQFTSAPDAVDKMTVLARLYPDMMAARHNLGLALAFARHDPEAAIPHFEAVAVSSHPRRGESLVAEAVSQLMLGRMNEADDSIRRARLLGGHAPLGQEHLVALALGQHEAIQLAIAEQTTRVMARNAREYELMLAAVEVDQGKFDAAAKRLRAASTARESEPWSRDRARLALAELSLAAHQDRLDASTIEAFLGKERARLGDDAAATDRSAEMYIAYAASLALRRGIEVDVAEALDAIEPSANRTYRLAPGALVATARCLERVAAQQLDCLDALPTPKWIPTQVAAWDVAARTGSAEATKSRSEELTTSAARGRALAEFDELDFLIPNLLDLSRARAVTTDAGP
jgi:hypothetical protein